MKLRISLFVLILLSLLMASCAPAPAKPGTDEDVTLKMALLPIIDTLPMYVAQQEGLFAKHGVKVEFVPVASAPDRDALIASKQADGMINETISTFLFNKDAPQVEIVRYALRPTAEAGHFFILASGQSGITKPEQLKGVEIGVSQGTVIEYVTDRLLEAQGFTPDEIKTVAVPKLPDRMSLLASGELKAAVLPDPYGGLAVQQGAVPVLDDSQYPQYGFSVISFRKEVLDGHRQMVKNFLAAIEEATQLVNENPGKYTSVLSDNKIVPQPLLGTYKVPPFPAAGVPTQAEWQDALKWAKDKGMISADVPYDTSVTSAYLP